MRDRRNFIKTMAGVAAGMSIAGRGAVKLVAQNAAPAAGAPVARREVRVGTRRVKVIDVHAHATIPEVADVVKGTPLASNARGGGRGLGQDRLQEMDKRGIDIQALSINGYWWYDADRDLATKIVQIQDEGLAKWCSAHSDRFVAFTSPALQFPDLAAEQLERAVKQMGMRGASIGGHVKGEALSAAKYDPFWAKAQELGVIVFMHPGGAENVVKPDGLSGRGDLGNIIGNPLETTMFFSQLIFDGTLDKFPGIENMRRARRRLFAILYGTHRRRLRRAAQREMCEQEEACRLFPPTAHGGFHGIYTRGCSPFGR